MEEGASIMLFGAFSVSLSERLSRSEDSLGSSILQNT